MKWHIGNSKNITIQESTEAVQMQQNPKLLEKQLISLQWFTIDLIGTYLAEFKMHFYFDLHSYIAILAFFYKRLIGFSMDHN